MCGPVNGSFSSLALLKDVRSRWSRTDPKDRYSQTTVGSPFTAFGSPPTAVAYFPVVGCSPTIELGFTDASNYFFVLCSDLGSTLFPIALWFRLYH